MFKPIRRWARRCSRQLNSIPLTCAAIESLEYRRLLSASISGTTLNITGGSSDGNITLSDNGAVITVTQNATNFIFADSAVSKINCAPGVFGLTINLLSNTKPVTLVGGGTPFYVDAVVIGDNGSLQNIAAPVNVTNPNGFTTLVIDGSNNPAGLTGTLSDTTLTGLSPGSINYIASQLEELFVQTDNPLIITNTPATNPDDSRTVIYSAISNPAVQVTVLGTTGPLQINLEDDGGVVDVGNGNVQAIKGDVDINPDSSHNSDVHINDSADPTGRNISINGNYTVTGIAPASITYENALSGAGLYITAGQGNDTLTIDGDAQGGANDFDMGGGNDSVTYVDGAIFTTIHGGAGNDTFTVGNGMAENNVFYFDGGTGSNTVGINDSADPNNGAFASVGLSQISFFGGGQIHYSNTQRVSLQGGTGNNTYTVDPALAVPVLIHGGAGNDLIQGGAKNDSLFGDAGNDTIFGGAGNDSIDGGDGNDSINGGPGADTIAGGTGIDSIDSGDGDPVHIIADDIASQGVTILGEWAPSTSVAGFYATDYQTDANINKGQSSFTWSPTLPAAGMYQVYARWTAGTNRADHVPYDVLHQGVTTTVFENQQKNNNAWVSLGTYNFNAGVASVTLRNAGTTGYVIADAVRFIPVIANASISGVAFIDTNGNGKQDPSESSGTYPPRVIYIDSNKDGLLDNGERSTTTDSLGNYSFTGLPAGTYRIRQVNVPGYRISVPANVFYDVTVKTGATASAVYGINFGNASVIPSTVPVIAVNAGGPDFTLDSGVSFSADHGFTGGAAATTPFDVGGTDNDPLYFSTRSSSTNFSYSLPVANGSYSLVLWFTDPSKTAAGQRKFNVTAQGQQVLTNFDIVATGGAKSSVIKTFAINVTNGTFTLSFNSVIDSAIVSAFALYPT